MEKFIQEVAQKIINANESGLLVKVDNPLYFELDVEMGYEIQFLQRKIYEEGGGKVVGYKLAYASSIMQKANGVDEPMMGFIKEEQVIESGLNVDMPKEGILKVEPEVVFCVKKDMDTKEITLENIEEYIEGWAAGFEIVQPKLESDKPTTVGMQAAENMCLGKLVLANERWEQCPNSWNDLEVSLYKNKELLEKNTSAVIMDGTPLGSVVWLAKKLKEYGLYLKKGDFVLTGSPVVPAMLEVGNEIEGRFEVKDGVTSVVKSIIA